MIADEIQSGLARSGKMLACDWEEVRPDVVVNFHHCFSFLLVIIFVDSWRKFLHLFLYFELIWLLKPKLTI